MEVEAPISGVEQENVQTQEEEDYHGSVAGLFPEMLPTGLAYYSEQEAPETVLDPASDQEASETVIDPVNDQEAPETVPDAVTPDPVAGPSKEQPALLFTPDQVRGLGPVLGAGHILCNQSRIFCRVLRIFFC